MASWLELSADSRRAAQALFERGHYRSSVSRSYYAAYAAASYLLEGKVAYPQGRHNAPNERVPSYIRNHLSTLDKDRRRSAAKTMGILWKARVEADYKPGVTCDRAIALNIIRDCDRVLRSLEVEPYE